MSTVIAILDNIITMYAYMIATVTVVAVSATIVVWVFLGALHGLNALGRWVIGR